MERCIAMRLVERPPARAMNGHVAVSRCHHILAISASLLVFTISLVLLGCGLTINSTAGSGPGQSTGSGSSGDGGPAGGQPIPAPGALAPLTGCTNPNTGVSTGDWGVGTDPVYPFVDNQTPVVGEPMYASNTIF